jgi:hypothetical protein
MCASHMATKLLSFSCKSARSDNSVAAVLIIIGKFVKLIEKQVRLLVFSQSDRLLLTTKYVQRRTAGQAWSWHADVIKLAAEYLQLVSFNLSAAQHCIVRHPTS